MAKGTKDKITLGSGIPYIMEFTGAMPTHTDICKPENRLGYVKGGAELSYSEENVVEKDDLGYVSKVITTSEEAILKLGLLTFNGETLQKLIDRCQVTEAEGLRTIHIGGSGNSQGKEWVICFYQEDKKDGNVWVLIRGRNTAGFTLTYSAEEGSVIEPEFTALPQDENGTLITMIEEMSAT